MTKRRSLLALMMLCIFVFAVFSSAWILSVNSDHDCIGDICPVCAQINIAERIMKSLLSGFVLTGAAIAVIVCGITILIPLSLKFGVSGTLTSLKVKLSN